MNTDTRDKATWEGDLGASWLRETALLDAMQGGVTEELVVRACLRPGDAVLDIGCGAGISTRAAARAVAPGGRATGMDISATMIEAARRAGGEGVDFVVADAEHHPFAAAAYDRIISQFGVMFFGDSRAAFENLRRAIRPGGRLAFAAWGPAADNPWFGLARSAAVAELGDVPADPDGPGPLRFRDRDATLNLLSAAGWTGAEAEAVAITLAPPLDLAGLARFATRLGPAASLLRQKDAGEALRERVVARLEGVFAPFVEAGHVRLPALVNFYTAAA